MKGILDLLRKRQRARLERRQLMKATGEVPDGWLARLVYRIKALNHERLARHRRQKQLLTSLAANDTATLEALVFLLESFRREQRTRGEVDQAVAKRLDELEARVDAGVRLLGARLQAMEGRILGATLAEPGDRPAPIVAAPSNGTNGDLKHASRMSAESGNGGLREPGELGAHHP